MGPGSVAGAAILHYYSFRGLWARTSPASLHQFKAERWGFTLGSSLLRLSRASISYPHSLSMSSSSFHLSVSQSTYLIIDPLLEMDGR